MCVCGGHDRSFVARIINFLTVWKFKLFVVEVMPEELGLFIYTVVRIVSKGTDDQTCASATPRRPACVHVCDARA